MTARDGRDTSGARWRLTAIGALADGVAVDSHGQLLLTMPDGIVRADLSSGVLDRAVPVPAAGGAPFPIRRRASWNPRSPPEAWIIRGRRAR
jgi:hypothetical protein